MNIGYGLNQRAGIFVSGRLACSHRHRFQHLPHNLSLQLRDLRLKSLRDRIFDTLPRVVLLLVLFLVLVVFAMHHAWRTVSCSFESCWS